MFSVRCSLLTLAARAAYLAPASPCELNIDHNLRAELIQYMNTVTTDKDAATKAHIESTSLGTVQASQLQTMVKLYERIQMHVFRLMATDSVPKFCKTERVGSDSFLHFSLVLYAFFESLASTSSLLPGLCAGTRSASTSPSREVQDPGLNHSRR